jgi:hypothetical protein
MQSYLFIGGNWDALTVHAPDDADAVQMPVGAAGKENYIRESLTIGGASVTIYRHENMPPEKILSRLIEYYVAWSINMPGGRR